MRELIEKLRAATAPSDELDALSTVALFGGELGGTFNYMWRETPNSGMQAPMRLTSSIDALNFAFERAFPGCGRIIAKGRVSETEPLYGCQIFSTDLSAAPLEPIGEGEHELEAYAYLIAMLQVVEAKLGRAA